MFGIILASVGALFEEASSSIGKIKIRAHKESPYTMAFLSIFWGAILFTAISIVKNDLFVFRLSSLPTFSLRAFLEIVQLYVSVFAIVRADRTTFSFLRTLTIPLLLLADLFIGYKLGFSGIIGVAVITLTILFIFSRQEIKKRGAGLVLFSSINAVFTISLFKYDISHFNSVAAEQLFISLILLVSFFFLSLIKTNENPFVFLTKPIFIFQSMSVGIGGVIGSFAYNYGLASFITAAQRSAAIFWSLLSGGQYFHERNLVFKILATIFLVIGLAFLAVN